MSKAGPTPPDGPPFPTHLWVELIISLEFIMAPIQLSCGVWWVIPSLPVSSGFCCVIKSQTYPLSPHWQFSSFGSRDGIFIVWQWTNSTDERSVCSQASPPFCRGRTELLLALLRCFLWLRAGMLLMSDGVCCCKQFRFQLRGIPGMGLTAELRIFLRSFLLSGKSRDANPQMDASL